jgi:hypothetical protein
MKTISVLFLMILVTGSVSALTSGPSASGIYRFAFEDGLSKSVEFDATSDERGVATGRMTFRDEAGVSEQDPDGVGDERPESPPPFVMTANPNSLVIERNRAVMGGTVTDSNIRSYIGKWVQLVVEDGEEDKFSWCFCLWYSPKTRQVNKV